MSSSPPLLLSSSQIPLCRVIRFNIDYTIHFIEEMAPEVSQTPLYLPAPPHLPASLFLSLSSLGSGANPFRRASSAVRMICDLVLTPPSLRPELLRPRVGDVRRLPVPGHPGAVRLEPERWAEPLPPPFGIVLTGGSQ